MSIKFAVINATASGDTTIVAGAANKIIEVLNYTFTVSTDVSVKFKSGSTDLSGPMPLSSNGGISAVGSMPSPLGRSVLFVCAAGEDLKINLSGTATAAGHLCYNVFNT